MKKLYFSFSTKLTFDNNVYDHSFALRCIPPDSATQHISACELDIVPFSSVKQTVDAFGNNVVTGYLKKEHRFLDFEVKGSAEIDNSVAKTDFMPCYRYQSGYTKPDAALKEFHHRYDLKCSEKEPLARAVYFMNELHSVMTYDKNATDTKTTAAKAFELKRGVCQDYAHIMLSILRLDDIPCRYIAGLASCDGETHAWVEIWDGMSWKGIDPTRNCLINDEYLVLSQGRDFGDCAIDRGVMFGMYTRQLQLITSQLGTDIF